MVVVNQKQGKGRADKPWCRPSGKGEKTNKPCGSFERKHSGRCE